MVRSEEPEKKPAAAPPPERAGKSFRLRSSSLNTIRLRRVFDLFDQNGDGEITLPELDRALARLGLEEGGAKELESAVTAFIKPGHEGLGFEDFAGLHQSLGDALFGVAVADEEAAEVEEELAEAFRVFDENGDGFISAKELQSVLGKLGLSEGRDITRVCEMISSVDRDHDGRVDFSEFKNMMVSISARSS
ncbi:unnamed protein product [Spirodela intermedia]|uniref:EF-hand domain-containing protein n=1 Tax=Spirodela intermedia TaxID=51605 RepID=A0A7I8IVQ5_SPIIN|nr:unnamed protein product [Spirodela intermedia]CAA6661899.1 unnamed protein product [Spirodela intermedia]